MLVLTMIKARFQWDAKKDGENQDQHGASFTAAQFSFADPCRVIAEDCSHSAIEQRHFCFAQVGAGMLTVRLTYRDNIIRILGAGYWRKGKQIDERENQIHEPAPRQP